MTADVAELWDVEGVQSILARNKDLPGRLLPVLHEVQDSIGYIPPDAVPMIAQGLNLSRAEVHGVITYYPHFRQHRPGKHVVQVCRAEACQSVGSDALEAHAKKSLCCSFHENSADGSVTLEPVYCLGHCAVGPNIVIDDEVHTHVTPERFDALLKAARSAE